MGEVTELMNRARAGERGALDRLFELLYPELRQAAHRRLARHPRDGGLETTALVNECYLRLAEREGLTPADRTHFLGYAAAVMRSVIVDAARAAHTDRRGGNQPHVTLDTAVSDSVAHSAEEILDVHAALQDLAQVDPRLAQVVEMRYFGGMTEAEIGTALGLTERTVRRDWEKARLLLAHALRA